MFVRHFLISQDNITFPELLAAMLTWQDSVFKMFRLYSQSKFSPWLCFVLVENIFLQENGQKQFWLNFLLKEKLQTNYLHKYCPISSFGITRHQIEFFSKTCTHPDELKNSMFISGSCPFLNVNYIVPLWLILSGFTY